MCELERSTHILIVASKKVLRSEFPQSSRPRGLWKIATDSSSQDALVPRLIAAFGSQRDRWTNASELQCYTGIAPVLETSGRQRWVHVRWACPKFVRQTFHEWALHSLKKCGWANENYKTQLDRGKSRHAAIRAVAFKWLRIAFRCWMNRSHYDSDLYLQSRSIRGSCATGLEIQ